MVDLRDRHVEASAQATLEPINHHPFLFQAAATRQVELEGTSADDHGCFRPLATQPAEKRRPTLQARRDLLDLECLDHIADLDVVEVLQSDAALVALGDLANIILETA